MPPAPASSRSGHESGPIHPIPDVKRGRPRQVYDRAPTIPGDERGCRHRSQRLDPLGEQNHPVRSALGVRGDADAGAIEAGEQCIAIPPRASHDSTTFVGSPSPEDTVVANRRGGSPVCSSTSNGVRPSRSFVAITCCSAAILANCVRDAGRVRVTPQLLLLGRGPGPVQGGDHLAGALRGVHRRHRPAEVDAPVVPAVLATTARRLPSR